MTEASESPKRVVLRYEEQWSNLRAQLHDDRTIGLTQSAIRDAFVDWLDDRSFAELGTLARRGPSSYRGGDAEVEQQEVVPADGVIAGWGELDGRLVFVSADEVALGGDLRGAAGAAKATRVREHALEQSAPLIQVFSAGRVDPDRSVGAEFVRFGFGLDLDYEQFTDERILKIAIVSGPLGAQASLEATWCHLVVLCGSGGSLFGCSGDVALARGMADLVVDDLPQALSVVGTALRHLPTSHFAEPIEHDPVVHSGRSESGAILDDGWAWDLTPGWCTEVQSRLGQVGGTTVGLLASERPTVLDAPIATKLLRTATYCRTFGCPLVIDHAGFDLPRSPTPADVHAIRRLAVELATPAAVVLEVARGDRRIDLDLGVRPLWSIEWPSSTVDETRSSTDARSALIEAAAILRRRRPQHVDDERVKTRPPRTLTGA